MTTSKSTSNWKRRAKWRRSILVLIIIISSVWVTSHMAAVLPYRGTTPVELAMVIVFGMLFGWISVGFWESLAGVLSLVRRVDRFALNSAEADPSILADSDARTAVLLPIFNEEVERVFAGLRVMYESLLETGHLRHFDFFVLSDSTNPDKWVEEEIAWANICASLDASQHIFYRHRQVNLKGKSGNIADFCRRWGRNYRYMIVLDADSIVTGMSLVRLVALMERHPEIGILQTIPKAVNRETLIARAHQFANHVYGAVVAAGLNYIQLGESYYWGHNAIIRTAPFVQHCGLPSLPGKPPRGGVIISHDFVEAAFMRRGGWQVWLVYDLEGSYEEVPPTLLDELKRDRRWCQGNLQHIRLLLAKGLFSAHRGLFLHGMMSYVSSLLWFVFLILSTTKAIVEAFREPVYFPVERALFPEWPIWHLYWAFTLMSTMLVILFLPRLLSLLLIIAKSDRVRLYGGTLRVLMSLAAETFLSMLVAPLRMLFHSKFVLLTLLGRSIQWGAQYRWDYQTGWLQALRFHAAGTVIAFLWGAALFLFNRSFFWWNTPVLVPLFFSIPISVLSSRASLGRRLRKLGLFIIPEEIDPPPVLRSLKKLQQSAPHGLSVGSIRRTEGFVQAVVDPHVNILHRSLLRRERSLKPSIIERRRAIIDKALKSGPNGLNDKEKKALLLDPTRLKDLHKKVWEIPDRDQSAMWGLSG